MGIFGDMFDFNRDGKLDSFEKATEFGAFMHMMEECEKSDSSTSGSIIDDTAVVDEITAAGLDMDELEFMDEDERRDALEDAGLDPDDFDLD